MTPHRSISHTTAPFAASNVSSASARPTIAGEVPARAKSATVKPEPGFLQTAHASQVTSSSATVTASEATQCHSHWQAPASYCGSPVIHRPSPLQLEPGKAIFVFNVAGKPAQFHSRLRQQQHITDIERHPPQRYTYYSYDSASHCSGSRSQARISRVAENSPKAEVTRRLRCPGPRIHDVGTGRGVGVHQLDDLRLDVARRRHRVVGDVRVVL